MDNLIKQYASILQHIYDNDTAGDYTFIGVLSEFAVQVAKGLSVDEVAQHEYEPTLAGKCILCGGSEKDVQHK